LVEPAAEARFIAVAAGRQTTCGLDETGRVRCWGGRADVAPTAHTIPTGGGYTRIEGGGRYYGGERFCVLDSEGHASCWSWDDTVEAPPDGSTWTDLDVADVSACGVAEGNIRCWQGGHVEYRR